MSDTTLYHTALDDMFKELLLLDADQAPALAKENNTVTMQLPCAEIIATPKRLVRIRQHNLFANEASFVICRHTRPADQAVLSPHSNELRQERQRTELLLKRRQRMEEAKKPKPQRLTIRI